MRFLRPLLFISIALSFVVPAVIGQSVGNAPVPRDPQAIALVQKAIATMGGVPTDSAATGTVQVVEGSNSETGTIHILTLGTNATSETISLSSGQRIVVYSSRRARETNDGQAINPPLETILTDQCPDFPLPLLSSLIANVDVAVRYIGLENVNGTSAQHVQLWDTFASDGTVVQKLATYSMRDVWLDSMSGLPVKIAYERRTGGGAVPAILLEVYFSDYKSESGVLYPFVIRKYFDRTPWQTIAISTVAFDTALTADQFQTE